MAYTNARSKGEAAYARADAAIGIAPDSRTSFWRSLPVVGWVLSGRTPSLWVYARLLFALGAISIIAGLLVGVAGAVIVGVAFGEGGVGFAVSTAIAALTFSTPGALFLVGSGVVAYLAARNDREVQHEVFDGATGERPEPPLKPVKGIAPKMDLGDYEEHKNDDPS